MTMISLIIVMTNHQVTLHPHQHLKFDQIQESAGVQKLVTTQV